MIRSQLCARQGCEADSLLPTTHTKAVCKQIWPQTPPHALGATRPAKAREPICSLHALSAPGSRLQLLLAAPMHQCWVWKKGRAHPSASLGR